MSFTVVLPDGNEVDVDAPDAQSAATAGRLYWQKNGPKPDALPYHSPEIDTQTLRQTPAPQPPQDMLRDASGGSAPQAGDPLTEAGGGAVDNSSITRNFKLGNQGAGRMLADTVGAPVDLTTGAMNLATAPLRMLGADVPRIEKPVMGSEWLSGLFTKAAEALGYTPETPQNAGEELMYNVNRMNPAGVVGGVGAIRAAQKAAEVAPAVVPTIAEAFNAPYISSAGKTIAGDVGAAAGAGAAQTASDRNMPASVKDSSLAPLVDFLTVMAGAAGGAGGVAAARATGGKAVDMVGARVGAGVPSNAPVNPATGQPYTKSDFDKAAAIVQGAASDPKMAAENIAKFYPEFAGDSAASLPTTGGASGDVGLGMLEKTNRTLNPRPFVEQDQRVEANARGRMDKIAPEGATPEAFTDRAASEADTSQFRAATNNDIAQRSADAAASEDQFRLDQTNRIRAQQGAPVEAARGTGPAASQRFDQAVVDQGYVPARTEKNRLYEEGVDPNTPVDMSGAAAAAGRVRQNVEQMPESLRGQQMNDALLTDIEQGGQMPYDAARRTRMALAEQRNQARAGGNFGQADNLGEVTAPINRALDAANPEAAQNYRENFAPRYRPGPGDEAAQFTRQLDRDPTRSTTPPSETAGRFIQPDAPERSGAAGRMIEGSQQPGAARTAARDYLMADLAGKNVVDARTGALRPNVLRQWAQKNQANIALVPGMQDEINGMLARAQQGERLSGAFAEELRQSRLRQKITPEQVNKNALSELAGADATHAVSQIFSSKNPAAAMDDIVGRIGNDAEARSGLKAAVREYLVDKATTSAIGKTPDNANPVSFAKLDQLFKQNEAALAKAFSPEEMNALRQAHKLLTPGKNIDALKATSGSDTAEKTSNAMRMLEAGLKVKYGMLKGGGIMRNLRLIAQTFPDASQGASEIVGRMWFDPELAQHLLTRPVNEVGTPAWNKKLFQIMGAEQAAQSENDSLEQPVGK